MARTKLQLAQAALEELGLPPWSFTIPPELLDSAIHRMDGIVAAWPLSSLQVAYNFGAAAGEPAGLSSDHELALILQLAIAIAPSLGKTPTTETKQNAATAYNNILIAAATPRQRQFPETMPRGEGQKPWRTVQQPYYPPPDESPLRAQRDDQLDIAKD